MGCCSPNYRKTVNEQEERVNEKGKDSLHWSVKAGLALITLGAMAITIIIY